VTTGNPDIRELLSFRLARLANTISRSAALRLRREFDVSIGEWRTIALVGEGQLSPNEIARKSNLDKGQVSRIVATLVERGLMEREGAPARGRANPLRLTAEGKALYKGLMKIARERDVTFLAALTDTDARALHEALGKLQEVSLLLLRSETMLNQRAALTVESED